MSWFDCPKLVTKDKDKALAHWRKYGCALSYRDENFVVESVKEHGLHNIVDDIENALELMGFSCNQVASMTDQFYYSSTHGRNVRVYRRFHDALGYWTASDMRTVICFFSADLRNKHTFRWHVGPPEEFADDGKSLTDDEAWQIIYFALDAGREASSIFRDIYGETDYEKVKRYFKEHYLDKSVPEKKLTIWKRFLNLFK